MIRLAMLALALVFAVVAFGAGGAFAQSAGHKAVVDRHNLTQSGIHQIQNANLGALARDKVWTSCTMILPLRSKGGSGSPVRPVAIGAP